MSRIKGGPRLRDALFLSCVIGSCLFFMEASLRGGALLWKIRYRHSSRPAAFTIYVVGDSTAFGEPFAPLSFPAIAAKMLGGSVNGKPINIVVLALPGSNTEEQYWRLLHELVLRPEADGAIFIYAGINESYPQAAPSLLQRIAGRSVAVSRLLYLMRGKFAHKPSMDYAARVERLIGLARSFGLPVVISTLVGNVRDYGPSIESMPESSGLYRSYLSARSLERKGNHRAAAEIYEAILSAPDSRADAGVSYRLAVCAYRLGRYDRARELFRRVVDRGESKRPTGEQNRTIRRLARKHDSALVDAQELFEKDSPHGLPGYDLFVDAHHPNLRGYALLGRGFAERLSARMKSPLARGGFGEAELAREFSRTKEDDLQVYASRVVWFCGESAGRMDRTDTLAMAEEYLRRAERILGREIAPLRFLAALTSRDRSKVLYWIMRKNALLKDKAYLPSIAYNTDYVLQMLRALHLPKDQEKIGEDLLIHAGSLARARTAPPPPGEPPPPSSGRDKERFPRESRSKEYLASKSFVDEGVALAMAGNWAGAYPKLARGAAVDPDNAEAHLSLCSWNLHEARLPAAEKSCARALAAAGKFPERYSPEIIKIIRSAQAEVWKKTRSR